MSTSIEFPEIEFSLQNEKLCNFKTLYIFISELEGDRKNRHRIRHFTGLDFEIDSDEYEERIQKTKDNFSADDLNNVS